MAPIPNEKSTPSRIAAIEKRNRLLKEEFLKYYSELPSLRLAAASIGRHEATVCKWKAADPKFKEKMRRAKAEFALSKIKSGKVSNEWLLPKLFYREFGDKPQKIKLDGQLNGKMTIKVVSYTAQNEKEH